MSEKEKKIVNSIAMIFVVIISYVAVSSTYLLFTPKTEYDGKLTIKDYKYCLGKPEEETNIEASFYEEDIDLLLSLLYNSDYNPSSLIKSKDTGYVYIDDYKSFLEYINRSYDPNLNYDDAKKEGIELGGWMRKVFNNEEEKTAQNTASVEELFKTAFENKKVLVGFSNVPGKYDKTIKSINKHDGIIDINIVLDRNHKALNTDNSIKPLVPQYTYILLDKDEADRIVFNYYYTDHITTYIRLFILGTIYVAIIIALWFNLETKKYKKEKRSDDVIQNL